MALDLLVVIPAFNEQAFIAGCIASVKEHLSRSGIRFDVIVVNNGSTDQTASLALSSGAHQITIERASISHARNLGAGFAPSRFIAFIDADVMITEAWASAMRQLINSPPSQPLLTGCQYAIRENASWIEAYWFKNLTDKHLNGGNIIVDSAAVIALGGFDETLKTGEDYDFCLRAQAAGMNYKIDTEFKAIHLGYPQNISGFIKREMWHGEGDFRSLQAFLRSPVAVISLAYALGLLAIALLLIADSTTWALSLIALFLMGNFLLTALRFRGCSVKTLLVNSVINFIYFIARALSLLRALVNKKNRF
jgi:glycosyltransferase involved in cell wall biosynthesis